MNSSLIRKGLSNFLIKDIVDVIVKMYNDDFCKQLNVNLKFPFYDLQKSNDYKIQYQHEVYDKSKNFNCYNHDILYNCACRRYLDHINKYLLNLKINF